MNRNDWLTLSDAIRLGAMLKPQGFGPHTMMPAALTSCALAAAADACGFVGEDYRFASPRYQALKQRYPVLLLFLTCPTGCNWPSRGLEMTYHLNDVHHWTRERIADWIETLERMAAYADHERAAQDTTSVHGDPVAAE